MKNVLYNGSITDDLNTINEDTRIRNQGIISRNLPMWILLIYDIIWITLGIILHNPGMIAPIITCSSSIFLSYRNRQREKDDERNDKVMNATSKITFLANNLTDDDTLDLTSKVTYENIVDAKVISNSEIIEELKSGYPFSDEDIIEYVKVITSEIYFMDLNNQIKVLKEVKKIANYKSKYKSYIKGCKLEVFEEKDLPSQLPVKPVLKSVEKEKNYYHKLSL